MSSAPPEERGKTSSPAPREAAVPREAALAAEAPARVPAVTAARYAPVIVAAATMTGLGLWGLARHSSMGNDEVATRWAALLNLHQLAHLLSTVDAVHGMYYLIMHGWMAIGTSPAVIRIPSVISMTAAVAMTVIIARRLTGSGWAGLFAGLIMALTPVVSYYAQTARSYALVMACVLGSTLALMRAMRAETGGETVEQVARWWLIYGALITLSGYLNELSLLVLTAHGVTVLLARYGRRAVAHWAGVSAAAALLVTPLLLISHREDKVVSWISRPDLTDARILFHDYFGATTAVAALLVASAVAAVLPARGRWRLPAAGAVAGGAADEDVASADTGTKRESPWWSCCGISLPSVAAPLLLVPAAVLALESLVTRPLYVDRYVLYGEAGAALLAGAGVYRIGRWLSDAVDRRALIWVPGVAVCLCALIFQLAPQQRARTPQSRLFDFGGPSRYVGAHAQRGDGVLFFTSFYRKARLGYPADFRKVSDFALAVPPVRTGNYQGRNKPFEITGPLMLEHRRIWVIGTVPSRRRSAGQLREESMVLLDHFSLVTKRHFRNIVVTLWLRR